MPAAKPTILTAILRQLKSRRNFDDIGIKNYREQLEKSARAFKPMASVKADAFHIEQIPAMWLSPEKCDPLRAALYIHGGGYIAGSIHTHQDLASRVALASQSKTLIFNYRLAPEQPFPAGLEDVKTVYHWLKSTDREARHISIVADSAGAGLALSLLSILLQTGGFLPCCCVLLSPWIDLELKHLTSADPARKDPLIKLEILKKTARLYAAGKDPGHPLISPINGDFTGICPVLIQTGENEILKNDSERLAEKLKKSGVDVQLDIWQEMFHVWHYFAKYLEEGNTAIAQIGEFIEMHSSDQ